MISLFYGLGAWLAGSLIARALVGAGLTLVGFAAVSALMEGLINTAITAIGGLPADAYNLLGLMGVWEGFSILFSAAMVRIAMVALVTRVTVGS